MRIATLRDLRNNFSKLESWLADGEFLQIRRRGQTVGLLTVPCALASEKNPLLPDFRARRKAIWGDRFFSEDKIEQVNAYELEGQEG